MCEVEGYTLNTNIQSALCATLSGKQTAAVTASPQPCPLTSTLYTVTYSTGN